MKKRNLWFAAVGVAGMALAVGLIPAGCEVHSPDEAQITVSPSYVRLSNGQSATFTATGWSRYTWSLSPNVGRLSATTGDTVTYTAVNASGSTVTLTANASLAASFVDGAAKATTNAPGGAASIAAGTATIVVQ